MFKRIWDVFGWGVGIYAIYDKLQMAAKAKDEIYASLSPEQRVTWESVFGKPAAPVVDPKMPNVYVPATSVASAQATPIEQITAGT